MSHPYEIESIESTDSQINGYYVCTDPPFPSENELTWRNLGNGPEIVGCDLHGPFASEDEAGAWCVRDFADSKED
jgi:hypothetical protein